MASMQDGVNFTAPPYSKVLLLGAIAATSAFVVTILIVLLCVGCQRKGKSNNVPGEGTKHRIIEMSRLRQSKLRSISKSDTKLHQMNQPNCNGKKSSKSRPASMDLLLLPSRRRRSHTDQRGPSSRQLPQIPSGGTGEDREHTYSEVGRGGSPQRCCPDDSLYEMVGGRAGETDTPAPPPPANTPAPHSPEHEEDQGGACEGPMGPQTIPAAPDPGAEYACVRKVRKVDKSTGKHGGAEPCERDLHQAPPPPIPHPHSQKIPRKIIEPFHLHAFPKEAVFMGNGEEYIWKPPEDDDLMFYPKPPCPMNPPITEGSGPQVPPAGVSELYSKVCKPPKKKRPVPGSPPSGKDNNGHRTLGREGGSAGFSVVVKPQSWGGGAQLDARGGATHGHASEDHCYEAIGEKAWPVAGAAEEGEPGYEGVDGHWRRERPPNATLKPRKKKPSQQHLPSDALYDSISDVRQAGSSSSTTTIFTFNDGMEMYVTGL